VPSRSTPRIQEIHALLGHILCELIESELYGKGEWVDG
jgi:D-sedoheptulose 7-phosphate isomerase